MRYSHWEFRAGRENAIRVELDTAANVQLLDDLNFAAFRRGSGYHYHGSYFKRTPFALRRHKPIVGTSSFISADMREPFVQSRLLFEAHSYHYVKYRLNIWSH